MDRRIFVIFLTVFIDLLGFGILIPILPTFAQNELFMSETLIGLTVGIFSLMQFIFNPLWGRLSDIYGRKPILIFGLAGNVFSYIITGLVLIGILKSIALLLIARALAGFFSANIGAAMAYISDVTPPKDRSKGMGLIGAAFGLGFVFGPFIGGVLAKRFGFGFPTFLSAGLSLLALILTFLFVNESLPKEVRIGRKMGGLSLRSGILKLVTALKHPHVGFLILLYFVIVFSISNIFSTFQLYAESKNGFSFDIEEVSYLFAFSGLVGAITQGIIIRPILRMFDERKVFIAGCVIMGLGLGTIPFSNHILVLLLLSILFMSFGNGLLLSIGLGLISKFSDKDEQGGILGLTQSLASLARFIGPSWGGLVYHYVSFAAPFLTGGIVMMGATVLSLRLLKEKYRHSTNTHR
ncbi:MAG: MFS transporter [Ignavibacteria bacterium]|nr:MFS transporter [Ignavibacteria bacterium]MCC7159199.1 MFS transporter [Ignavibacteria bacterium]